MSAEARLAEQRRRAAKKGNEIRSRRAAIKAEIAAGEVGLDQILVASAEDPDIDRVVAIAEEIRVGELLRSVPGIGPATVAEILDEVEIDGSRPLCDVGIDKRAALAEALTENERS